MKAGLLCGGYRKAPPDQLKLPTAPRTGPSWEARIPGLSRWEEEDSLFQSNASLTPLSLSASPLSSPQAQPQRLSPAALSASSLALLCFTYCPRVGFLPTQMCSDRPPCWQTNGSCDHAPGRGIWDPPQSSLRSRPLFPNVLNLWPGPFSLLFLGLNSSLRKSQPQSPLCGVFLGSLRR